ncbi:uncharacterized protein SCHCODRAFT_01352070 [Schizophyllum commune H4-8]|uniref:Uncharacterized protein n=1 Tax=Schizophyllum commune (strain H4-8 / FGSC 9210) TaxID=578458 RepID=D8Q5V8_SCHCM|nr:uncharacterized protein SCHCODRAFT_01352070 [Schizophyllum commune H4-8]KAI5892008.1 hypothetical protein SCHCODRAFT_01352070 [Schizophyllum commune H4-8]
MASCASCRLVEYPRNALEIISCAIVTRVEEFCVIGGDVGPRARSLHAYMRIFSSETASKLREKSYTPALDGERRRLSVTFTPTSITPSPNLAHISGRRSCYATKHERLSIALIPGQYDTSALRTTTLSLELVVHSVPPGDAASCYARTMGSGATPLKSSVVFSRSTVMSFRTSALPLRYVRAPSRFPLSPASQFVHDADVRFALLKPPPLNFPRSWTRIRPDAIELLVLAMVAMSFGTLKSLQCADPARAMKSKTYATSLGTWPSDAWKASTDRISSSSVLISTYHEPSPVNASTPRAEIDHALNFDAYNQPSSSLTRRTRDSSNRARSARQLALDSASPPSLDSLRTGELMFSWVARMYMLKLRFRTLTIRLGFAVNAIPATTCHHVCESAVDSLHPGLPSHQLPVGRHGPLLFHDALVFPSGAHWTTRLGVIVIRPTPVGSSTLE